MRSIRYSIAMSLDGFIAGENDEFDWIIIDPDMEFAELYGDVDTYLLGRRAFEVADESGLPGSSGDRIFVFSRTLRQTDYPTVQVVGENAAR